jgi:hypothetical protein
MDRPPTAEIRYHVLAVTVGPVQLVDHEAAFTVAVTVSVVPNGTLVIRVAVVEAAVRRTAPPHAGATLIVAVLNRPVAA